MTKISGLLQTFEGYLSDAFESETKNWNEVLKEAAKYSLFSGGKRVRPVLTLLSAEFCGVEIENALPFAVAVEFIHTYSLIHDDLPCMDNDDFRRGKLTCHKKFGEAIALLAGDALLNAAYEFLLEKALTNSDFLKGAHLIADCAGGNGMISGQAAEFSSDVFNDDILTELCMKKTGALIQSACLSPCINMCDPMRFSAISTVSRAIGLAFQLVDDILDKEKAEEVSFVSIIGEKETKLRLERLQNIVSKTLKGFPDSDNLLDFSNQLFQRMH